MKKEYVEREQVKDVLLSLTVCIKHPEHLLKEDALCVIDTMPAADVVTIKDAAKAFAIQTVYSTADCEEMILSALGKGWIGRAE